MKLGERLLIELSKNAYFDLTNKALNMTLLMAALHYGTTTIALLVCLLAHWNYATGMQCVSFYLIFVLDTSHRDDTVRESYETRFMILIGTELVIVQPLYKMRIRAARRHKQSMNSQFLTFPLANSL